MDDPQSTKNRLLLSLCRSISVCRHDDTPGALSVRILVNDQNDLLRFGAFKDGLECNLDGRECCSCGTITKHLAAEQRKVFACNGLLPGKEDHTGLILRKSAKQACFAHAAPSVDYGKLEGTLLISGF